MDPRHAPDGAASVVRIVGYAAGTLTTLAFVPQVIKSWRTRSTGDLSLAMLVTFTTGVFLWLTYGLLLGEPPIIINNAVTFVLAAVLLWIRARPRAARTEARPSGSATATSQAPADSLAAHGGGMPGAASPASDR